MRQVNRANPGASTYSAILGNIRGAPSPKSKLFIAYQVQKGLSSDVSKTLTRLHLRHIIHSLPSNFKASNLPHHLQRKFVISIS